MAPVKTMDIVSSTGAILGIIALAVKVGAWSYGYVETVKGAREDILALVGELGTLNTILTQLHAWISANPGVPGLAELIEPKGLLNLCLGKLKPQLEELDIKSKPKGWFRKAKTRLAWPLTEKETLKYITRLETQKSSLLLALAQSNTSCLDTIQKHILNMSKHVEDIATHTLGTSLVVQDIRTIIVDQRETKKRDVVLKWLYAEPLGDKHKSIVEMRQDGTGKWLLQSSEFQEWVNGRLSSQLLWGYGIPGAGKTFLSSIVIDHLRDRGPGPGPIFGVAHIYFEYHEKDNQSPLNIMSSLVRQLLNQIPTLPAGIERLYHILNGSLPTLEDLFTALITTRSSFNQVFLVLDALDEIKFDHDQWRDTFLSLFRRMGDCGINIFMTSRPHLDDIRIALESAEKIKLITPDEDLELYIQRIYKNPRAAYFIKEGGCGERITPELLKCCNGMFLLVRFHIEYLTQQTTTRKFLNALDELKNSSASGGSLLDKTYYRAMECIRNQRDPSKLALKVLAWLVKAKRTLSVEEIRVAVSVEQDMQELDELDIPDRITLQEICGGLVTIDNTKNTIQFAHQTVHEYLSKDAILLKDMELKLAMACTTYLCFDIFDYGACVTPELFKARLDSNPFLDYAAHNLSFHLKKCDQKLSMNMVLKFLGRPGCISSYMQALNNWSNEIGYIVGAYDQYPKGRNPLHIASSLGHYAAAQSIIEGMQGNLLAPDSKGQTALHAAAKDGNTDLIRLLLKNGADCLLADHNGRTALHVAAHYGREAVVRLLLDKGANISSKDREGKTALHAGAVGGSEKVVRLLLDKGADISATDNTGCTALHVASFNENLAVIQLLLEEGVNCLAQDEDGSTAMDIAKFRNSEGVLRLLDESLQNGA